MNYRIVRKQKKTYLKMGKVTIFLNYAKYPQRQKLLIFKVSCFSR